MNSPHDDCEVEPYALNSFISVTMVIYTEIDLMELPLNEFILVSNSEVPSNPPDWIRIWFLNPKCNRIWIRISNIQSESGSLTSLFNIHDKSLTGVPRKRFKLGRDERHTSGWSKLRYEEISSVWTNNDMETLGIIKQRWIFVAGHSTLTNCMHPNWPTPSSAAFVFLSPCV